MKQGKSTAVRKFHFMVAALVIFHVKGEDGVEGVNTAHINTLILGDEDKITAHQVGKAQQAVQMQFFKKLGEESTLANVLDVTILNFMNLGYMTEEEFQAVPDGLKKQEVAKAGLKLVEKAIDEANAVQ